MNTGDAQIVLDAAPWVLSAGTACAIVVELVKRFLGVESPRAIIAAAVISAFVLVIAYAAQNGIGITAQPFTLLLASLSIAASGAGAHSALTSMSADRTRTP